ncbi:MAG: hypothetical protein H6867_04920 [Rhodospirillales bacterium]|nr:hypothetical protein [Rhodospirillales bacterium]MCB9994843.1 hypothetical protein [Rhodospirillales bacterium]
MTEEDISTEKKIQLERELLITAFADDREDARLLNARYDATKNNRWIKDDTEILPNGTYRYQVPNIEHLESTNYVPAPVTVNPIAALAELDRQDFFQLMLSYDGKNNLWRAQGILNAAEYVATKIEHSDISQAVARAIMSAVCMKRAFGG